MTNLENIKLLCGRGNSELFLKICSRFKCPTNDFELGNFLDNETSIQIRFEPIGKSFIVLQVI